MIALQVVIGLSILALGQFDNAKIKKTEAPNRLKRIVKSTAILAILQPGLGVLLYLTITNLWGEVVRLIMRFLHVTIALAIITQASSVATAYDMWEEHEYAPESRP